MHRGFFWCVCEIKAFINLVLVRLISEKDRFLQTRLLLSCGSHLLLPLWPGFPHSAACCTVEGVDGKPAHGWGCFLRLIKGPVKLGCSCALLLLVPESCEIGFPFTPQTELQYWVQGNVYCETSQ